MWGCVRHLSLVSWLPAADDSQGAARSTDRAAEHCTALAHPKNIHPCKCMLYERFGTLHSHQNWCLNITPTSKRSGSEVEQHWPSLGHYTVLRGRSSGTPVSKCRLLRCKLLTGNQHQQHTNIKLLQLVLIHTASKQALCCCRVYWQVLI